MNVNKELVGASTGILILGVIARAPGYGYQIIKEINEEADGLFSWREGTIYPVLHKLEQEGLICSEWEIADTGRRRKYYHITSMGREALAETSRQWTEFHSLVLKMAEVPNG